MRERKHGPGRAGALIGLLIALAAAPAAYAKDDPPPPQADFETSAELIKVSGAERTVRVTLTNLGPDAAYAGDPNECMADGLCTAANPPRIGLSHMLLGPGNVVSGDLLSESAPCSWNTMLAPGMTPQRVCYFGTRMAAGAKVSVDVRVRLRAAHVVFSAGVNSHMFGTSEHPAPEDPSLDNNGSVLELHNGPTCKVKASSPQKLTRRTLDLRVLAPSTRGCTAKLTKVELKIAGKTRFRMFKPREHTLAASGKWTIKLHYGTTVGDVLRTARRKHKAVSARAVFEIDNQQRVKDLQLK